MNIKFGQGDYESAQMIRRRVFMEEQGYRNEFDDLDLEEDCIHVVAYDGDAPVGCARVFPSRFEPDCETVPSRWVLGRLAVLPEARKGGMGSKILGECERIVVDRGGTELHLHAQCQAQGFYDKNGYAPYGDIGYDEGEPHQWMMRVL